MRPDTKLLCLHLSSLLVLVSACTSGPGPLTPEAAPSRRSATPESTAAPESAIPLEQAALVVNQQAGSDVHWLTPIDPQTGNAVAGYGPIEMGANFSYRLTPDRRTLVFVSYPNQDASDASLHFLDLETWEQATGLLLPTRGWTSNIVFSPDGSRLAFAATERRQGSIWLVDAARRVLLNRVETPQHVAGMEFTADGQALMLYARQENYQTGLTEGPPVAELRSAKTLELQWSRVLEGVRDGFEAYEGKTGQPHEPGNGQTYRPAVVFDPQTGAMFVLHADADRLTRVDFQRREILTQDIRPKLSWLERILAMGTITARAKVLDGIDRQAVIAPDGETVYMAGLQNQSRQDSRGSWELLQTHLPLQAVRLRDAAELYRSEASGDTLRLSADSTTILLSRWGAAAGESEATFVIRAADGEILDQMEGVRLLPSSRLDGSPLLVASSYSGVDQGNSTSLAAYNVGLRLLGAWTANRYGDWIILP